MSDAELDLWCQFYKWDGPGYDRELWKRLEAMSPRQVKVTVYRYLHTAWDSPSAFCETCGTSDCANLKNSAAMCPGPAP